MNKTDILNYFLNNYNDIIFSEINENLNGFWKMAILSMQ